MATPSEIEYVQFGLTGDEERARQGVVDVDSFELFSGPTPVDGGVYDDRMGTTDNHYRCGTCENNKKLCPGHPGRHRLPVGVQNPLMIADTRRWLQIICLKCGTPVVDPVNARKWPAMIRLAEAATDTSGRRCAKCGTVHPKIIKDDEDYMTFLAAPPGWKPAKAKEKPPKLFPHEIKAAFERVSPQTVEAFGKPLSAHPRKAIVTLMQIPPISIRPGVKGIGPAGNSYHDVTNMLQYLVKRNKTMPERLPIPITSDKDDLPRKIQTAQQLYYDLILGSASTSASQGSRGKRGTVTGSRPTTSILRRIPRKEGRIRRNLIGKRVWMMSRNTLAGNSRLKIDQVGFPVDFARTVQIKETIQEFNRDRLMQFFLNGRRQYPGCTRVRKRSTGREHDVDHLRRDFQLEVGDVLYRDIVTGDIGFYNRQPSLERSAIGVHEIVVFEDPSIKTFQMNVSACDWYGADFNTIGVQQVAAAKGGMHPFAGKQCKHSRALARINKQRLSHNCLVVRTDITT